MMKELLIVGIDPGTTLAYALLDTNGNLIKTSSSKQYNFSSLVSDILSHGTPLIVSSDRKQCPSLVENFAVKLGAKLILPDHDLTVSDKQEICRGYEYSDNHERDALASAIFAYKRQRKLFDKIGNYLKKNDLMDYSQRVKEICVKDNINVFDAVDSLMKRPEAEHEELARQQDELDKEKIFLKNRIRKLSYENELLKQHNLNIKKQLDEISKPIIQNIKKLPSKKIEFLVNSKESTIFNLQKEVDKKNKQISEIKEEQDKAYSFIANLSDNVLLKKLDNLGWSEFQEKNKVLDIKKGDLLYVTDISVFNQKTIEFLKNKVQVIIYDQGKPGLNFVLINSKGLDIRQNEFFAQVDRESLDKKKKEINLLMQIVNGYRK